MIGRFLIHKKTESAIFSHQIFKINGLANSQYFFGLNFPDIIQMTFRTAHGYL